MREPRALRSNGALGVRTLTREQEVMHEYFSDKELGLPAQTSEEIDQGPWGGIVAVIRSELDKDSFGLAFPSECPDGGAVAGNDWGNFSLLLGGEIPNVPWPLRPDPIPNKFAVLDLIQFCYRHVAEPKQLAYHSYFNHHHLSFDREAGRQTFRQSINRIFARNGIAFDLQESGSIIRLADPALQPILASAVFDSGDTTLDMLLEDSRRKFLDPDPAVRRESLEKLWDALERIKTIEPGHDKKQATKKILDHAAPEPRFRDLLETDARELTRIGNEFRIRHSETTKTEIYETEQVDYLFQRTFALVMLLLKRRGK